jgi:hypothetical protein
MARLSLIHRSVRSSLFLAAVSCAASSAWAISPACGKNSLGSGAGNAAPAVACAKDETLAELLGFPVRPGLASGLAAEARAGALPEPAGVAEASAASAPSDEERADATRTIKTSDHVLVRAESSYGTIIHEAQVKVSAETIENTAGTFGDPSRYFQVLPGVVSDNDQRNDMLVRGGSPTENLFVIDGIVIPSINHLALSDTTGGFVSMIDNNAIESITLHDGVHDARFADRLSSVVEISTLPESSKPVRRIFEAGLAGVGATTSMPWGDGNVLFSGRESVLNLMTNDIGMNGVPKYNNSLVRGDRSFGERDKVWGLALTGIDSIQIRPCYQDPWETSSFDIDYSGWRNTTGMNWQHVFGEKTFGVLTVSNAEQAQNILEADQLLDGATTYSEQSHEGTSTASYNMTSEVKPWLLFTAGVTHSMDRIHYNIQQPVPLPNPYSATYDPASVTGIVQQFHSNVDGGFAQATLALPLNATLTLSGRADHWAYGDHTSLTPRALLSVPVLGHRVGFGYAEYTQMPSYLFLLAFPGNNALTPIKAEHSTFDLDLVRRDAATLTFSASRKLYCKYPVPVAFPELSMANVADTFGQSALMFPLVSAGHGRTEGVELNLESHPVSRLHLNASAAYARAWYSGLDGILRRGNYDIPLTANVSSLIGLGKGYSLSARYSGASGRPYTPDNLVASVAQDRDVYNLSEINRARSNPYGRLDLRIEQKKQIRNGILSWNVGLLNVLDQKNFYANLWEPNLQQGQTGYGTPSQQDQMPRFPEGSVKYTF